MSNVKSNRSEKIYLHMYRGRGTKDYFIEVGMAEVFFLCLNSCSLHTTFYFNQPDYFMGIMINIVLCEMWKRQFDKICVNCDQTPITPLMYQCSTPDNILAECLGIVWTSSNDNLPFGILALINIGLGCCCCFCLFVCLFFWWCCFVDLRNVSAQNITD